MRNYTQRVRNSILPLSVAATLPKAFEEWRFTGLTVDHGDACEVCELCGQEGLRYHFQIENYLTRNSLEVGSHCILDFDVGVYDGGVRLSAKEAAKVLNKRIQQMRVESCLAALSKLAEAEANKILRSALEYYRINKFLTPKFAFVVFWRLKRNGIDHDASFFKVSLKKQKYRDDLAAMDTSKVHFFWMALTAAQRKMAIEMGHIGPNSQPSPELAALMSKLSSSRKN